MPRDRLAAMQKNAYMEDGDEFIPVEEDPEGPLKDYFKEIEEIRDNCEKVNGKVEEVKVLQSQILSSPAVNLKHQQQMDDLMADIKKIANGVRSNVLSTPWVYNLLEPVLINTEEDGAGH